MQVWYTIYVYKVFYDYLGNILSAKKGVDFSWSLDIDNNICCLISDYSKHLFLKSKNTLKMQKNTEKSWVLEHNLVFALLLYPLKDTVGAGINEGL